MIRKLKIRFICLAMGALFLVMAVSVASMNAINYSTVVQDADTVLHFLSRNKGTFPEMPGGDRKEPMLPAPLSPETPYESRYFSVLLDGAGEVLRTETGRIFAVDLEEAEEYGKQVFASGSRSGFLGQFRYLRSSEGNATRIVFLDCGRALDGFYTYLWVSIGVTLGGLGVMFLGIVFFAGRIVRPIGESYEKQRRFITDAGHEIKTPLTILSANVDLLEADPGDPDCLQDMRQQIERLTSLTNDLVYLARMEETDAPLEMGEVEASQLIAETAAAFRASAVLQHKKFLCRVQPGLTMKGNRKALGQLVNLTMDNALKYSPEGGTVAVEFFQSKRTLQLHLWNTTETALSQEALAHVFDRFYRIDPSRNSETGGSGIGLSVAKAIVEAHHGTIRAWTQEGHDFHITCIFPG